MLQRPVLIGMNSPQSEDPAMALYPWSRAATGGRILEMIQDACRRAHSKGRDAPTYVTQEDYLRVFDRRNLLNSRVWNEGAARLAAPELMLSLRQRDVVICGVKTLEVMGLRRREWLLWSERDGEFFGDLFRYVLIPHPSGLTRDYNDPEKRAAVGDLLLDLYTGYVSAEASAA